eukprot:g3209.t1
MHFLLRQDILEAARKGRLEAVRRCVEVHPQAVKKAEGDGRTALWKAASGGHGQIVAFLLANGAHVDSACKATGRGS